MKTTENYRPSVLEFDVANNSNAPESFGKIETEKEVLAFIHGNLTAINQGVTVNRFMDNFEKTELRKEYQEMLELKLPLLERELLKAQSIFDEAKSKLADAKEMVSATTNEVKAIATEVKNGVKAINLDEQFTWRVPFNGKFYYYTWIDKELKLCKVKDIAEHEKSELWSASAANEVYFITNFPVNE